MFNSNYQSMGLEVASISDLRAKTIRPQYRLFEGDKIYFKEDICAFKNAYGCIFFECIINGRLVAIPIKSCFGLARVLDSEYRRISDVNRDIANCFDLEDLRRYLAGKSLRVIGFQDIEGFYHRWVDGHQLPEPIRRTIAVPVLELG